MLLAGAFALGVAVLASLRAGALPASAPPAPDASGLSADSLQTLHAAAGVQLGAPGESVGPVSAEYHARTERLRARLDATPDDAATLDSLATLLYDAHKREEAATYYERLLELDPGRRQAWLDLANCYGSLVRWSDVGALMTRMLVRFPDDASALYNLGVAAINQGSVQEAREWWERAARQETAGAVAAMARAALERTRDQA
ncbi:MAG: tetratricopeptide repeat protein [Gemmatimonadota bacterium]|nr:tetratricopeptide repeat protein [Gemmatimonadota bacterium]